MQATELLGSGVRSELKTSLKPKLDSEILLNAVQRTVSLLNDWWFLVQIPILTAAFYGAVQLTSQFQGVSNERWKQIADNRPADPYIIKTYAYIPVTTRDINEANYQQIERSKHPN